MSITAREVRFDEGLEEDERGWFDDEDQDADDEDDARSVETASLRSSWHSEAALDPESSRPWHTEQTLTTRRMSYPRSSSLPPHPASVSEPNLPVSAPPSLESSINAGHQKKRARFEDDSITSDLIFRRGSIGSSKLRRRSAPPAPPSRNESYASLVTLQGSEQSEQVGGHRREDLMELAAAVGIFEEVVDELIDAAEENAESQDQIRQIADEVRETMIEDEDDGMGLKRGRGSSDRCAHTASDHTSNDSNSERRSAALDRTVTDYEPELELYRCSSRPGARSGSAADDDVDESVATAADDEGLHAVVKLDDERLTPLKMPNRSLLMDDEEPELKSPPLTPVLEEESESSTETVRITRPASPEVLFPRRVSDSQAHASLIAERHGEMKQRRASMTDFCTLNGRLKVPAKASPAGVVITACSVRPVELLRLQPVYEDQGALQGSATPDRQSIKTAHTVRSASGVLQMLWEDPAISDFSSDASSAIPIQASSSTASVPHHPSGPSSPMEKVKSKLATWKWARENAAHCDTEDIPALPLLSIVHHSHSQTPSRPQSPRREVPPAPPNTEKSSAAASAKPSAPHTRPPSEEQLPISPLPAASSGSPSRRSSSDEEEEPLELRVRATFSQPHRTHRPTSEPSDYLTVPVHARSGPSTSSPPSPCSGTRDARKHVAIISRQLSNLAAEEAHFQRHRDSVELMRHHREDGKGAVGNQALMGTRDSFVLANARRVREREKERDGGKRELGTIVDASPPNSVVFLPLGGKKDSKRKKRDGLGEGEMDEGGKGGAPLVGEEESHPDEHANCPIYEIERPRWYEAKFGQKRIGT